MTEISDNAVIFSFPQVDERAILRVHYAAAATPEEAVRINEPIEGAYRLGAQGPVAIHLRPNVLWKNPGYPSGLRYPFALLVSVGGKNALTGNPSSALVRSPQNYLGCGEG